MSHGRRVFLIIPIVFLIAGLLSVFSCNGDLVSPTSPPEENPPANPAPSGQNGSGGGPSGNNPADFPNVTGIDFAALPQDPGPCSGGNTWHVATSGNDGNPGSSGQPLRSMVRALQLAQNGDTILVHAGNYPEGESGEYRSLVIHQSGLRLCAAPGESVTVTPKNSTFTYGLQILGKDTLLDGIHFSGFTTVGVLLGEGTALQNIYLRNLTITMGGNGGRDGVATWNTSVNGLYLSNLHVHQTTIGIQCNQGPCQNWRMDRVTVHNDPSQGDTAQDAIAIESGDNFLLSNVEVTGAAGDGLDFKGSRVAVFNANVHDNRRNGVKFWRGGDLVNSFVVHQGADAAVVFDGAGSYRIMNSLIAYQNFPQGGSYTMTVAYDHPSDPVTLAIVNSVFFNNSGSIWLSPGTQGTIQNTLLTPTVDGEILTKGNQAVTNNGSVSDLAALVTASGNLEFNSAPLFPQAPASFDFPQNSPLRDAGSVPADLPDYDFFGNPRTQGAAPDLGPVELF